MSFLARLGGVLVEPRGTLRRVAGGEGGIGEVLGVLVVLLFVEEAARVARALAAAPYLGAAGVASQILGILGGAVPDLLALLVAAAVLALVARRKGRELDLAACALLPWFTLRLVAQLAVAAVRLTATSSTVTFSNEGRLLVAGGGLAWGAALLGLAVVELRRVEPVEPVAPKPLAGRATGTGALLVLGLVALTTLQLTWIGRHTATLRPAGTSGAAPDFRLSLLDGGMFHLREDPPTVTLVDFWATWCGPCREELPVVDRLAARYRGRARVVAVEVSGREAVPDTRLIARRLGLSLPIAVVGDRTSTEYHVNNLPHLVLVDRHGEIRRVFLGIHAESEIAAALDEALAQP